MNIILAIIVFSFLMLIHELGHFLMAKKLGIKAYELSIGMGPKLFGKEYNSTQYNIRAIPFGAYVRFGDEEDEFFTEPDNFMNKSALDRIKVIIMGPLVNIVTALLIMIGAVYYMGFPTNTVGGVSENFPAQKAGVEVGDTIIKIGNTAISDWATLTKAFSSVGEDRTAHIVVQKKDGREVSLDIQMQESEGRYIVGITPMYKRNAIQSIKYGAIATAKQSTMMIDTVKQLFIGKANIDEFSGPVGIVNVVGEAADAGFINVVILTALISLNLGILNLVPIPGLDGSKILFYGFELITKKPVNREIENRLTIIGFMLIMAFSLFITYKDILKIFQAN